MILSEAISAYLAYRRLQQYARNTVRIDERTLRLFLHTVGDLNMRSLGPERTDRWLSVRSTRCQPSTLNTEQACLASFEKWCHQRGHLAPRQNLTGHLRNHRIMRKQRLIIPSASFPALLGAASDPTDRAVVALGLYLFARQGEISSLQVADLNLELGTVDMAIHKSRIRDVMPVCAELDREMRRYLTWRSSFYPVRPSQYLVCAKRVSFGSDGHTVRPRPDSPITRPYDAVGRALTAAGYEVDSGEGCHTLRRSGATALYQRLKSEGHDHAIRTCQAMLHHASVTTTERYLDISADRKQRDDLLRGQSMFEINTDTVVPLFGAADGMTRGA